MTPPPTQGSLYPQYLLPVVGAVNDPADEFDLAREQLLLAYGYNTARAYFGDLEDWRGWCESAAPEIDPLHPGVVDIEHYLSMQLTVGYSPNTVARRLTALRQFFATLGDDQVRVVRAIRPIARRSRATVC